MSNIHFSIRNKNQAARIVRRILERDLVQFETGPRPAVIGWTSSRERAIGLFMDGDGKDADSYVLVLSSSMLKSQWFWRDLFGTTLFPGEGRPVDTDDDHSLVPSGDADYVTLSCGWEEDVSEADMSMVFQSMRLTEPDFALTRDALLHRGITNGARWAIKNVLYQYGYNTDLESFLFDIATDVSRTMTPTPAAFRARLEQELEQIVHRHFERLAEDAWRAQPVISALAEGSKKPSAKVKPAAPRRAPRRKVTTD